MATIENFVLRVKTEGADNITKLGTSVDAARAKFEALGSAILAIGFGSFILKALASADAMVDLSDSTGIAVSNLVAFSKAVEQAGGKADNTERIITSFYNTIEAAADGSLKLQEAFGKVGVSLDDLRNLSEEDLLKKTIQGLSQMEAGSERTRLATLLLTRAFRSVDPKAFMDALATGNFQDLDRSARAAAEAIGTMEKVMGNLKLGAVAALEPILKLFADQKIGVEAATTAFKVLGGVMLLAFGASILRSITTINAALGITAGLSNLIGKGPLGLIAKLAAGGAAAAAAGIAIDKYMESNAELERQARATSNEMENLNDAFARQTTKGPAGRTVIAAQSPEEKARLESIRRIAAAEIETRKITALSVASESERIEIESASAIESARAEIFARENLSKALKEREFAAIQAKINADLAAKQKKLSDDVFLKRLADAEAVREETAKDIAQIDEQIARSTAQGQEQARIYKESSELARERADLEQSMMLSKEEDRKLALDLLSIDQRRKQELEKIATLLMDPKVRAEAIKTINDTANAEIEAAIARRERTQAEQEDFVKGWANAYEKYKNSAKTAAQQAQSYFDTFVRGFEDAIVRFVQTGKLSFRDLANSIIAEFARAQANKMASSLLGFVTNMFTPNFAAELAGGLRPMAMGGSVDAGSNYLVGERGPELFVPRSAGTIIPNHMLGGGGGMTTVNYNIQAVDAQSFRSLVARDPQFIYQVTEAGRRSQPTRRLA